MTFPKLFLFLFLCKDRAIIAYREHICSYIWENNVCFKCFTYINSLSLYNKSLRWLYCCHLFTHEGIVTQTGQTRPPWDRSIHYLVSDLKHLITCSTNPNIAGTVAVATVYGALRWTWLFQKLTWNPENNQSNTLRLHIIIFRKGNCGSESLMHFTRVTSLVRSKVKLKCQICLNTKTYSPLTSRKLRS